MNQCDGCMAGFPLNEKGHHVTGKIVNFAGFKCVEVFSCEKGKYMKNECKWIKCSEQLPPPNKYVLVILNKNNWRDGDDQEHVYYKVAKLVMNYTLSYEPNNEKPYNWREFGPSSYFGQEVDYWMPLPNKPEKN
jgi:hypothetical protein